MSEQKLELRVQLEVEAGADPVEIEGHTLQLREQLLELDVDAVEQPSGGPAPEGSRAFEASLLGSLVITGGKDVIGAVVRAVAGWLSRGGSRSVKLQLGDDVLELSNASSEDQHRLMEAFLARHAPEEP